MFAIFLLELTCDCKVTDNHYEVKKRSAMFISNSWINCEKLAIRNGWLFSPRVNFCLCPKCLNKMKCNS